MHLSQKRIFRFGIVILLGASFGYAAMGVIRQSPQEHLATRVYDRFEELCLNVLKSDPTAAFPTGDQLSLRPVQFSAAKKAWVDPDINGILTLTDQQCALRFFADTATNLTAASSLLRERIEAFLTFHAPDLTVDPKARMHPDDVFISWSNWQVAPPGSRRRGVVLWAGPHGSGEPTTLLSLSMPRSKNTEVTQ